MSVLRQKNPEEIINRKLGTKMVKDGRDQHGALQLQTTNLKTLGSDLKLSKPWHSSFHKVAMSPNKYRRNKQRLTVFETMLSYSAMFKAMDKTLMSQWHFRLKL